jgi:hypothetical protein
MTKEPVNPASPYAVELLCKQVPAIAKPELLRAIRKHCPEVLPLDGKESSNLLSFIHPDHLVEFGEKEIPAQTFIAPTEKVFKVTGDVAEALKQSWGFEGAEAVVKGCRATVLVTDLMSSNLDYQERLELFQNALAGALEVIKTEAIFWQPSQQIISAKRYLEAHKAGDPELFFTGALNVRMFNISNSSGDMLMDTLGLSALGLPDLQCHFHDLDPSEVARVLGDTAYYLFQEGDVFEDGNTVPGVDPKSKWRCRHEDALLEPLRPVVDLDPGKHHAAGKRA